MIVIIDYRMGNVRSIQNMLKKNGTRAAISCEPSEIRGAEKLILPGVGSFDTGMQSLERLGLIDVLGERVAAGVPILGICLGMQLMTKRSEEGLLPGLGWIDAETRRFAFSGENSRLKIPHMGWNRIAPCGSHPLFAGLEEPRFYFVHSYHPVCADPADVLAVTQYGYDFACSIGRKNVLGVQFHPEKSHHFGMTLLRNFVEKM